MRLRYSINVTLDGCCHHETFEPDAEQLDYWATEMSKADALLFGRVTYQMMEEAWRLPPSGVWPEWMSEHDLPFARYIDAAKKYVVSSTLDRVDWNAELITGDLADAVKGLKAGPGELLWTGGVTLPTALAGLGLIDEYEFVVLPVVAGYGPRLLDGLPKLIDLRLVGRREFASGVVALRYEPRRSRR